MHLSVVSSRMDGKKVGNPQGLTLQSSTRETILMCGLVPRGKFDLVTIMECGEPENEWSASDLKYISIVAVQFDLV